MSYVVTIRRDASITEDEWRRAVTADPSLAVSREEPTHFEVVWRNPTGRDELAFILTDGEVWATPKSDAALAKMQSIARFLDARVIGEHGEDLTDTEPSGKVGCATTATCFVVLIASMLIAML